MREAVDFSLLAAEFEDAMRELSVRGGIDDVLGKMPPVPSRLQKARAGQSITPSLGRSGTCWDTTVAERCFATLKVERCRWPTRQKAQTAIFEFIDGFYNRQRRHSSLGSLPPVAFEAGYRAAASAT